MARDGVRLAALDFGGTGPSALLLHGLAGYAGEWAATAHRLTARCRVVALDARGHGRSERTPAGRVQDLMRSLRRWPVPFSSREAAVDFFGGPSPSAEAWAGGLELRAGGWWPRFDAGVMARTLREATQRSYWVQWERISCPVLVVRAGRGQLSAADARAMAERGQRVEVVDLPAAGHDLHLDSPDEWLAAVGRFLDALDAA